MATQDRRNTGSRPEQQDEQQDTPAPDTGGAPEGGAPTAQTQGVDDLLDEIDGVLESNAEEFVRGFVQKGGQ
ncbi:MULTISPECIES: ubiquitin-like protein Pup [unclassified Arthrobacter]|uniref:ubiquitin-like protein Pup n=1 Tax=unclassified Arthrobacter TaxID=235627 RepID=UPI0002F0FFE7|nr:MULTISPECIES: ubiquitin-like protein Pup [unclassified Arthrobacter]PVE19881.1 ubiquitin-like protein Pup [Arthrobacter sp. Bz4]